MKTCTFLLVVGLINKKNEQDTVPLLANAPQPRVARYARFISMLFSHIHQNAILSVHNVL